MKRVSLWTGVIGVTSILLMGADAPKAPAAKPNKKQAALIKQGEYLAKIGLCDQCHTPYVFDEKLNMPVPDQTRWLAGHPSDGPDPSVKVEGLDTFGLGPTGTSFKQPFGTVYAANLTPDPDTGLGKWTDEDFINAMRKGLHKGTGRPLLPPMPWFAIRNLTEADMKALFAYLKSLPPVKNAVPAPKVSAATMEEMAKKREAVSKALKF